MPAETVAANTLTEAERGKLVLDSLKLCKKLAVDATRRAGGSFPGMEFADVESEAVVACVEAARRWDPTRGVRFATYCWTSITKHLGNVLTQARAKVGAQIDDWDRLQARAAERPEPDDPGPAEPDPDFTALAAAVRDTLADGVLEVLGPAHRRLVERCVFDGLSAAQIAEQDGHPVKIVRANLKAALRALAAAGLTQGAVTDEQVRAATAPQNPTTAAWARRKTAAKVPVSARQHLDLLAGELAAGNPLPGLTDGVRAVLRQVADRAVTLDQAFGLLGPDPVAVSLALRMAVVRLGRGCPAADTVRAALGGMPAVARTAALARLTRRFRDVARLVGVDGLGVDEAAARLRVKPHTVRKHLATIARGLKAPADCDATPNHLVA